MLHFSLFHLSSPYCDYHHLFDSAHKGDWSSVFLLLDKYWDFRENYLQKLLGIAIEQQNREAYNGCLQRCDFSILNQLELERAKLQADLLARSDSPFSDPDDVSAAVFCRGFEQSKTKNSPPKRQESALSTLGGEAVGFSPQRLRRVSW